MVRQGAGALLAKTIVKRNHRNLNLSARSIRGVAYLAPQMAERESAPQTPEWLTTAAGIVDGGGGGGTRRVLRDLPSNSTPMREIKAQMARMQQEVAKARTEAAAANQRNQVLEAFAGIASATRIASSLRRRRAVVQLQNARAACVCMQAACRGLRARKLLRIWSACALEIEASARSWLGVTAYARARGAALELQTASRRWAARRELRRARAASIRLQAVQRTRSMRRVFMLQRRSASLLQGAMRRYASTVLHDPRVTKSSLRLEIVRLRQHVHLLTAPSEPSEASRQAMAAREARQQASNAESAATADAPHSRSPKRRPRLGSAHPERGRRAVVRPPLGGAAQGGGDTRGAAPCAGRGAHPLIALIALLALLALVGEVRAARCRGDAAANGRARCPCPP